MADYIRRDARGADAPRELAETRLTGRLYSSAVREILVEARHCATMFSPSQAAKTMFVLPASIASSISERPRERLRRP